MKLLVKNEFCNYSRRCLPTAAGCLQLEGYAGGTEVYVERYPELGNRQLDLDRRRRCRGLVAGRPGIVLQGQWTVGRCLRSRCSRGRPSSPGVRSCCSNSRCSRLGGGSSAYDVDPDGRFLIIRRGPGGSRRRHGTADRLRAELVRGAEAAGADEVIAAYVAPLAHVAHPKKRGMSLNERGPRRPAQTA